MATTNYSAGLEVNQTQYSYAMETAFCGGSTTAPTPPAVAFQAIRYMSETLTGSKSRQRPSEINLTRESTQAVTVSESATGAIAGALSFGTYDDFFASTLNSAWQTGTPITGVAGDITLTNVSSTSATLSSTLTGKFTAINTGQYIRLKGFTNAVNNAIYRVAAKADSSHLTLTTIAATVTETPALAAAQVVYGNITNGSVFSSLYLQQRLSSSQFLVYPGSYVNSVTIQGSVGQFIQSNFNVVATQELQTTTDASTGATLAAPSGTVHNSVGNFQGVYWNDVAINGVVDSFSLTIENQGAQAEFGIGSSIGAGILTGTLLVSGSLRVFHRDFSLYNYYKNETVGRLTLVTADGAGNAYAICIPACTLMNPSINAGSPGTAIMASYSIEGNPKATGGTVSIDRLSI